MHVFFGGCETKFASAMASGMVRASIVTESSQGSDSWKIANRLSTGVI